MSFYSDASLVMIPSGYKTSKVYCAVPTDGAADLAFTRSNDTASRIGPNGLIQKVRTNLALYSEQFDNAAWTASEATVSANATTSPTGTTTADKVIPTAVLSFHNVTNSPFLSTGASYSISVYAKADGYSSVAVGNGFGTRQAIFNLTTGVVTSVTSDTTASIVSAGNGWFRCSVAFFATNTTNQLQITVDDGSGSTFVGDGTSGVFLWGAQIETGDIATDYIATTSAAVSVGPVANVPRLDYTDSTCPRLLLEPQRTNLALYSEQFDNAAWSKSAVTITANDITSPDGYTNADKMVESATTSGHYVLQSPTLTAAAYTFTIFAKAGERNWFLFRQHTLGLNASFNLATGTLGTIAAGLTATIEDYGNDWYRCSVTFTGTAAAHSFRLYVTTADNSTSSYLGDGTSGLYLYGAGCELGSYPTSYIPTLGAAVTRGEDNTLTASLSGVLPQTAGTLFWDIEYTFLASSTMLMHNTGVSDYCFLQVSGGGLVEGGIYESGVVVDRLAKVGAIATGRHKMAFAYSTNSFALYVDGVLADSGSSGSTANISMNTISLDWNATDFTRINQVLLFPTRLTNAQLAELTTI
jgi:hypothetical protein